MTTGTIVRDRRSGSNIGWIAGALMVVLLLGALAFTWNRDGDTTAGNTNTNATAPASTTGSAATTGSGSTGPTSNVPQSNKPAQ